MRDVGCETPTQPPRSSDRSLSLNVILLRLCISAILGAYLFSAFQCSHDAIDDDNRTVHYGNDRPDQRQDRLTGPLE